MNNSVLIAIVERAVKTFAQTLLAAFGTSQLDILAVDLKSALSLAIGATMISVLTSLASISISGNGPSVTSEKVVPETVAGH